MSKERKRSKTVFKPEVFIVSKKNEELLKIYSNTCQSLFGSDVRYDVEGNIFYPVWHEVKREKVNPDSYLSLSKELRNKPSYLSLGLVTKRPLEIRIHKITKDGGSVESSNTIC